MTNEEAIEDMCMDCVSYPCYTLKNGDMCYSKKTLLEALEKQIPKKPEEETYFKNNEWEKKCPTCGDWVILNSGTRMKFCCNCGQAIDWGEAE